MGTYQNTRYGIHAARIDLSSRNKPHFAFHLEISQNATAEAAATLRESTPWCIGMRTV